MEAINFYMPITSQPRELDAKLLLALFARERGMNPVIGYKSTFQARLASLPPGFFLVHNARQKSEKIDRLRRFGHKVLVLDEEALVRQSDEIFMKKHPRDAFEHVNWVFAWGDDDFKLWPDIGMKPDENLFVTGNPRVDTMRPETRPFHAADVAGLRARFGRYVLFNTNFPTVNNLTTRGGGVRLAEWALDERGRQVEQDFLANKRRMYEAMLELVPRLARAIAPTMLLIRPHPNEDHEPWHRAARDIANAQVVFEGGVVPWIIGARALVHNNCTTAVEAAVLGTPILNFRPWRSEFDNGLAHAFGTDCTDFKSLAARLEHILGGGEGGLSKVQASLLRHHISHLDGPFACERIVDLVQADGAHMSDASGRTVEERSRISRELKMLWWRRYLRLFTTTRGLRKFAYLRRNFPRLKVHRLDYEMLDYNEEQIELLMRQFPPPDKHDIDDRIRRFSLALGRFANMEAKLLGDMLFTIA
ncbi:MAG: surface carbohydrate biosynthesis protein [Pseudomonadota bacterium]|nr:surface carbohydrate biosynthesis protein [Pseudomonadota bacterium]